MPRCMKSVEISTGWLAYVECGPGQWSTRYPTVLLVHGFPLDHGMWEAQIDVLGEHARVIAPDLRGFGQSCLDTADPEREISMERYADDLAELLDAIVPAVKDP